MSTSKIIRGIAVVSGLIVLIFIYKQFNPADTDLFPACPFHSFTGLQCPGCGSQRAVHHLLNFEFLEAFHYNVLLVLAIPYFLLWLIFDIFLKPSDRTLKWKKILFGKNAILFVISWVILFWVFRNSYNF